MTLINEDQPKNGVIQFGHIVIWEYCIFGTKDIPLQMSVPKFLIFQGNNFLPILYSNSALNFPPSSSSYHQTRIPRMEFMPTALINQNNK